MNNIVISDLYKRIQTLSNYFKFDNHVYNTLYSILTQGVFTNRTLNILNDVKKIKGLDGNTLKFVDDIIQDVIVVGNKIAEINDMKQKLNRNLNALKEEFKKRNLPTEHLKITDKSNLNSLEEMEEYLKLLKKDEMKLEAAMLALNQEKQAGEEFDKELEQDTNLVDKKALEDANKVASDNVRNLVNPDVSTLNDILNYYTHNRGDNENFNVKMIKDKNNDVINIELSHKGTTVDENRPKFIITYTDVSLKDNGFLYQVINDYAYDNVTKAEGIQNGVYINVSESGDTLEMENFDDKQNEQAKEHIDKVQSEENMTYVSDDEHKELERKDKHVRVREMDNTSIGGKVGPSILLIIIVILVLGLSIVIANGIFNFLKG